MINGDRLRELREEKGLNQTELGEYLGVKKSAISLYEHNKRQPSLENMLELCYLFGVSMDYLFGSEIIVEIINEEDPKYRTLTKEEMLFIEDLRKDRFLNEVLLQNHKRGIELIKKKIG